MVNDVRRRVVEEEVAVVARAEKGAVAVVIVVLILAFDHPPFLVLRNCGRSATQRAAFCARNETAAAATIARTPMAAAATGHPEASPPLLQRASALCGSPAIE